MARCRWLLVVSVSLASCLKKDPLYCDENTPCTDPALPFCDHDGEFAASEGIKHTCIPDPFPDGGTGNADAAAERTIVGLATSETESCAVFNDGGLRCWGRGYIGFGYLETLGDEEFPYEAGDIPTGGPVKQVAIGHNYKCILYQTGNVRCWGYDGDGVLGNGSPIETTGDDGVTAAMLGDIPLGARAEQIAAGSTHACALLEGGGVRCWGANLWGELGYGHESTIGDNETPDMSDPVNAGGIVTQIAVGGVHTCALLETKDMRCWGSAAVGVLGQGASGDIGDNESPADFDPIDVGGDVKEIAAGDTHTCALLVGGDVRCWGNRYALGNPNIAETIGDDEVPSSVEPVPIGGTATQIIAGSQMTCALLQSGSVRCWGDTSAAEVGALGYGGEWAVGDNETPQQAGTLELGRAVEFLSAGGSHRQHTCVMLVGGDVRCWGLNADGELGLGHTRDVGDDETPDSQDPVRILE